MNCKVKNRHRLKTKDIKEMLSEIKSIFDQDFFDINSSVEIGDLEDKKIVFVDNEPSFMYYKKMIFFTLHGLNKYKPKKRFVVVDMGAVKFVTKGADIMAPGIVDADKTISENDLVWVCDETHHKPLAVGIALMSGEEMVEQNKGKSIEIVHHVGDSLWNFFAKKN